MAFQQGLSGLNAAARHLDTIGHNVANASTVGFKASRAEFADVYATTVYGVSNVSPGIGVEVGAIAQQFAQGAITTTNNSLDLGINGGGFFRMSDNGSITYTREGQFKLDKSGYIVNASGKRLTGYPVDKNGIVTNGTAQDLKLESTDISPKATTNAAIRVNVDARATTPATAFNLTDAKTYDGGTSVSVFDSLGREHVMALYFRKTADNTWSVHGTVDGNLMKNGASLGELKFNPNGTLNTEANGGTTSPFEVTVPVGADADVQGNQKITLNFSDTTQFGTNFTVAHQEQNGNGSGKLAGFSVERLVHHSDRPGGFRQPPLIRQPHQPRRRPIHRGQGGGPHHCESCRPVEQFDQRTPVGGLRAGNFLRPKRLVPAGPRLPPQRGRI